MPRNTLQSTKQEAGFGHSMIHNSEKLIFFLFFEPIKFYIGLMQELLKGQFNTKLENTHFSSYL